MKKSLVFLMFILLLASSAYAMYVEIGSGTSGNGYVPVYGSYAYSWSGVIYTASEIGQAMTIESLSYYLNNTPSNFTMNNLAIYMWYTANSQWTSSTTAYPDPINYGYQQVFNGSITWNGTGWFQIDLDTPFEYNGTDNLVIFWENRDGSGASGYPTFRYTSTTYRALYKYSDSSFPTTSGSRGSYRVNIRMHYSVENEPTAASNPVPVNNTINVPTDGDITWTWGDNNTTYDLWFGPVGSMSQVVTGGACSGTTGSYSYSGLTEATAYSWYLVSYNPAGYNVTSSTWNFITAAAPVTSYPYLADFETGALPAGWLQDTGDAQNWSFDQGGTSTSSTGPSVDHTLGTADGWYCYYEATGPAVGDVANLITVPFDTESLDDPYMRFWYHMYGADMGTLNVDILDGTTWTNLWTMSGNQGDTWYYTWIDLTPYSSPVVIRFQGIKGDGTTSDIAIDDVAVLNATGIPSEPTNLLPADNAVEVPMSGSLTWDWGANNATYDLWFGEPGAETQVVTGGTCSGVSGSWSYTDLPPLNKFNWWIVVHNSSGEYFDVTGTSTFTSASLPNQVAIGYGNVAEVHLPMEPYYRYSYSQSIYKQSDIEYANQQIESIWYYYNGNSAWSASIVIWMAHTSQSVLTDWIPIDGFIKVFEGTVAIPAAEGWVAIPLDIPFYYNNVDNLVVGFEENAYEFSSNSDEFYNTNAGSNVSIYYYSDSTNPDPYAPPVLGSNYSALSVYQPNIVFNFGPLAQPDVTDLYISEISDNIAGQDSGTGYIEIYNNIWQAFDIGGCAIVQGNDVAGTFTATSPEVSYIIPAGTIITPREYFIIGNGADETTFKTAWGITGDIAYLPGDATLDITNGWAYQINTPTVRAELDHSPNVPVNEEIVQMLNGTWQSGVPADGTPGGSSSGQALPVEMSSFTAIVTASKTVMLEWMTQSETGMIGYHVLRGDTNVAAEAIRLTDMVIEAENSSDETAYSYEDLDVAQQRSYYYWLEALSADGETDLFGPVFATVLPDEEDDEPDFFATTMLKANCPNPFNPSTEIAFELRGTEGVPVQAELAVYNVRGQRVKTLVSGMMEPGAHSVTWNGTDENGRMVSSGVYFYRLTAPNFNQMHKMMLLK